MVDQRRRYSSNGAGNNTRTKNTASATRSRYVYYKYWIIKFLTIILFLLFLLSPLFWFHKEYNLLANDDDEGAVGVVGGGSIKNISGKELDKFIELKKAQESRSSSAALDQNTQESQVRIADLEPDNTIITKSSSIDNTNNKNNVNDEEDFSNVPAYVVSLILCTSSKSVGYLDAAAVLRHSIHKQSKHNPNSKGKYSYKIYAIIHSNCAHHAPILQSLGYETLIRDTPINRNDIKNEFYKKNVEREICCGSAEFIKMYAYTLTKHPVVVHFDLDKVILKPMDDLFDAIIYDGTTEQGQRARKALDVEFPEDPMPDRIDAFFTRDYTLSWPWKKVAGVQGGLIIIRPNEEYFKEYMDIILEGNYEPGYHNGAGWGGLGFGGWIGGMAFQGVVPYFYDHFHPGTAVELDVCRWNQVAADVIWRGPKGKDRIGECKKYPKDDNHKTNYPRKPNAIKTNNGCDDCRITPISELHTVHYTACKKPWTCPTVRTSKKDRNQNHRINTDITDLKTCMLLHREWFALRKEFDELHYSVTKNEDIQKTSGGEYEKDYFLGYCEGEGEYTPMVFPGSGFDITKLYPSIKA